MDMAILANVALFDFIVGGSTGEKTVEADDFIREVGKMLPKGTFSWVSKFRTEAKREILKVGVARRVNNRVRGYFVPLDRATVLSDTLKGIRANFLKEKAQFLIDLPKIVNDWANHEDNAVDTRSGAKRADLIRTHAPNATEMDRMLSFDISAIQVQHTSFFGEDDALHSEVKGLVGQAAFEIAEDTTKSWKGPIGGKTSSRVLGLVRRIRNKADAMAVLSPKFENLKRMCDEVLAAAPHEGLIEGVAFLQVSTLLSFCSSPKNILSDNADGFDPLAVEEETPEAAQATLPVDEAQPADAETEIVHEAQAQPTTEQAPAETPQATTDEPAFEF